MQQPRPPYLEALDQRVLVFDGAMGTSVQRYELTAADFGGETLEGCNDYLVITRPDVIEEIHASFMEAGADVLETDTFRSNRITLREYDLQDRVREINVAAAMLARGVADRFSTPEKPRFVAGSIGPSGFLPSASDPTLGNITFAELRQQLKDAQEKARREAEKSSAEGAGKEKEKEPAGQEKASEVEVDFDLKETGQTRTLAGYDARQVVMTITVREKGKALEENGGLVVRSDLWLGPEIPAMKELADFELRYWKAIAPETAGVSAEQLAAVMAMYPMVKQGIDRLNREKVNLKGAPLLTVTTFEAVKGKEQMARENESSSGGGIGGLLARKMMKKEDKPRATIFTLTGETLEVSTSVAASDLEIPAGFKLDK